MNATISISIVILGILLVRGILKKRISKKLQYSLWGFVPLVLILGIFVKIESPVSMQIVQMPIEELAEIENEFQNIIFSEMENKEVVQSKRNVKEEQNEDSKIADSVNSNVVWNTVKQSGRIILGSLILIYNSCICCMCYRKRIFYKMDAISGMKVYLLEDIRSPFLFGKSVYLNPLFVKECEFVHHAILHEYCHYKQGDSVWNIVKLLILTYFWYNPLVWLAFSIVQKDCELACDEAVIQMIGMENREAYGMSLIRLLQFHKKNMSALSVSTAMKGGKGMMKERIAYIAKGTQRNMVASVIAVFCMMAITGCGLVEQVDNGNEHASSIEAEKIIPVVKTEENTLITDEIRNATFADNFVLYNGETKLSFYETEDEFMAADAYITKRSEDLNLSYYYIIDDGCTVQFTKNSSGKFTITHIQAGAVEGIYEGKNSYKTVFPGGVHVGINKEELIASWGEPLVINELENGLEYCYDKVISKNEPPTDAYRIHCYLDDEGKVTYIYWFVFYNENAFKEVYLKNQ
ncbi:MAG: M56 family metallopeptidase [Ruminococcus sp.]|nr:M56 family metallopeptidase [Ruminococcus sp.]